MCPSDPFASSYIFLIRYDISYILITHVISTTGSKSDHYSVINLLIELIA